MKKMSKFNLFVIVILDVVLSFFTIAYNHMFINNIFADKGIEKQKIIELIKESISIKLLLFFVIYGLVLLIIYRYLEAISKFIYKYRYLIALLLFVLCIIFEISGSSIGMWDAFLPKGNNSSFDGVLFGTSRIIRTDEWAVNTPMAFSQYYNDFSYFSDVVRGSSTDMFIVYGQAVKDIGIIFRPFYIGYLFLNQARGLSFFWCGRIICLFMVTFEMGMLITNKNKKYSVVTAFLITFAPLVQWWFAVNGLIEMLIYSQLAVIMLYKYMNTKNYLKRTVYIFTIMLCAGGYILTFYPAWMVPLFYVLVSLIIWVLITNWRNFEFSPKKDLPIWTVAVILFGICMLHIFINSKETIETVLNTVYPGKRVGLGGGGFEFLWKGISNLFYVIDGNGVPYNLCEDSVFFDLFPLGLILALYVIFKQKKKDTLIICLLIVDLILTLYVVFSWPEMLAKITLLSYSTTIRANGILGLVNVLLLIRSLSIKDKEKQGGIKPLIISTILVIIVLAFNKYAMKNYMNGTKMAISFLVLFILFNMILLYNKFKNELAIMICVLMLFMGCLVNPIRTGADVIYKNDLSKEIENVVEDNKDALWLVEDMGLPMINYPMMLGAHTINCTNVYPAMKRWKQFDADGENEKIYNRYAHIEIKITSEEETNFNLKYPDNYLINLNINDLKKLGVKYILSTNDLETFNNDYIYMEKLKEVEQYKIFEIKYK